MNQKSGKGSGIGWLWQRITGIFLAFFVIVHINVLHFGEKQLIDFKLVSERLQSSVLWVIFYIIFVAVVFFHGLNGLWQIIHDYRPGLGAQKTIKAFLWVLGIIAVAYGILAIKAFL